MTATKSKATNRKSGEQSSGGTVFDKHKQSDEASAHAQGGPGLTWIGRILIFLGFPTCVGFLGLYLAYLENRRKPEREMSFDVDFVVPFLLALTFIIVIGFQTRGFTSQKFEPLVQWPKVRKKKVIREVKKSELGTLAQEASKKDETDKKDD